MLTKKPAIEYSILPNSFYRKWTLQTEIRCRHGVEIGNENILKLYSENFCDYIKTLDLFTYSLDYLSVKF